MSTLEVSVDSLDGAMLIGLVLSTTIYGITCLQVFLYFTEHSRKDTWPLKTLVIAVWLLDTGHVALITHVIYHDTITNFGNYEALLGDFQISNKPVWSLMAQIILAALLTFLVQSFFAYRIYILGRKRLIIPLIVASITTAQTVLAIIPSVRSLTPQIKETNEDAVPYIIASLGGDLLCDCTIAAAMVYYLYNGRTMVPTTNRVVHLLIKYTINTCLLEAISVIPCFVILITEIQTLDYAPFYFILFRLYSCSLLCSLNNRTHLRDISEGRSGAITMSAFRATRTGRHSMEPVPKGSHGVDSRTDSDQDTQTLFRVQSSSVPQEMVVDVRKAQNSLV